MEEIESLSLDNIDIEVEEMPELKQLHRLVGEIYPRLTGKLLISS